MWWKALLSGHFGIQLFTASTITHVCSPYSRMKSRPHLSPLQTQKLTLLTFKPTLPLFLFNFLFPVFHFCLHLVTHPLLPLRLPQAALLNSFPAIFDELLQMFTVQEVAEFVRGTLGSMPSTVHIGQSMDVVKLQSIARTVDSRLFSFPGKGFS